MPVKTAIIPGNGAGNVHRCNWYGWLKQQLHKPPAIICELRNMPDPVTARESIWIPFMRDELKCDEDTVIIGHSSGAAAAMRFAERYPVAGIVLVSAYTTDQDDPTEVGSGYFSRPWEWEAIKKNAGFVLQLGSEDDPFLPWSEQFDVAEGTGAQLLRFTDKGHFMDRTIPELMQALKPHLDRLMEKQQQQA